MKAFFRALTEFLRDDAGELSCMRLLNALISTTVLGVWAYSNLRAGHYVPLGMAEAGLVAASQGAKSLQSRFEYGPGTSGRGGI